MNRLSWATAALLAGLLHTTPVLAAPPVGGSGEFSGWYKSLTQPGASVGCCDESDCRPVEAKTVGDHYEVWLDDRFNWSGLPVVPRWEPVPAEKILKAKDNPTGQDVACWTPYLGILCFVVGNVY